MSRFLILALVIGAVLRLVWLSSYPAGFTPDEAAFGYNAYSLLHTGRDEWGTAWYSLPFTSLRSFGDYKLPLYAFLAIPTIKIFGLTEFAVRLPNALLGILAIVAVYLLANKLFPRSGPIAALLLAISPWHIGLSRGAFEANLVTFLLPLGIYFFLKNLPLASAVIFALNIYSYHSARLLTLPVLCLLWWYHRPRHGFKFLAVLVLLSLPALYSLLGSAATRISDVGIFHPTDNWKEVADRQFAARAQKLPPLVARLFTNKLTYSASLFIQNYLSYLSFDFLFTSGAGESSYGLNPGRGLAYYLELPLLLGFIILLIKKPSKPLFFLLLLLLISPLPAALAKGPGHAANRAAVMIPFLIISFSVGLVYLFTQVRSHKKIIIVSLGTLYLASLIFFLQDYRYHTPAVTAPSMSYGWGQLLPRLQPFADRFADVRFSRSLSEPHIFLAFYWQIDPRQYQQAAIKWSDFNQKGLSFLDQYDGYYLGKYRFGDIHPTDSVTHPVLFIGKPSDFPPDFPRYFDINYPSGLPAITVSQALP